jgi:glutamyl-tRNA synthetase
MRVRFAPSPTGFLHVGGLRTALYNYLLARQMGGAFVLRIEDTDRTRFVEGAEQDILGMLAWAGLSFDEGPGKEGPFGPYRQSERSARYKEVASALVDAGKAYIAFDDDEAIEAMRERHRTADNPSPRYDHATRMEMANGLTLSAEEVLQLMDAGTPYVIRLRVDPGSTVLFTDAVRGEVSFESGTIDDQVLIKSDGLPTYHLANIVDDHDMRITHVIRGEEWLPSTPKHVLLYEAMGWEVPSMAHLPLIMSPTGGKLSKRNAEKQGIPVSVSSYVEAGYEPQALINFLALLGWNPGDEREVFSMEELIDAFTLERVGQSGVQFDLKKLQWFNEQWLRERGDDELAEQLAAEAEERFGCTDVGYLSRAVGMMKERMSFARDLFDADYLFASPQGYDETAVAKRWKADSSSVLKNFADTLEACTEWDEASLEATLKSFIESEGVGMGAIMFPLRMALSGVGGGPSLYALMDLIGKEETLDRIRKVLEVLPSGR